jgi:vitamin B12 transporter
MRKPISIALALGLVSFGSHPSHADDSDAIVVTATRNPMPISTIGSSVSVLTQEDLQNLGVSYVDDALRTLPGVSVSQTGGPGGQSSVRIRGEEGYRTLVLLDGIRIDDPSGTQVATNFADLLVSDIAQIEVVRGPQSLLYGPDAIGGVVQILTDRPQDGLHYRAQASAGAYHTFGASGALLYGADKFGIALSAADQQTQGFTEKVGDPALDDPDGQRILALHGVMRAQPLDTLGLEAVVHYTDSVAQFDGESAFPPYSPADPYRDLTGKEVDARFALTDTAWDGRITTELAYALSSTRHHDLDNGLPYAFGSRFYGDRQAESMVSTIKVAPGQTFVAGADHTYVSATTDAFAGHDGDTGGYGEWESAFGRQLYLTTGLRYDDDTGFGSHLSGRATAAWLADFFAGETTRWHTSYGTGFRAPSPYERATNEAAGLPSLKEEQSRGYDFGVSQSILARSASLDITYFEQIIENEIRYDDVNFTGYFQALGHSMSRGLEVSGHTRLPVREGFLKAIDLDTSFTYTDARVHSPDAENGLPRIRRPRYASASTLTFRFGENKASLALTVRTAAKTEDGFAQFRVPLDSYAVLDMSARWNLTPAVEIFLRGDNILDQQYEEVAGFATSDAAIYAGIRLRD